jgi:hypothetical protein
MTVDGSQMPGHHDMNAQAPSLDTAGAYEGDLKGELFPQHPKVGPWYSLAGDAAEPWELSVLESHSTGDTRHQTVTKSPEWQSTIVTTTGVTRGVGTPEGGPETLGLPNH